MNQSHPAIFSETQWARMFAHARTLNRADLEADAQLPRRLYGISRGKDPSRLGRIPISQTALAQVLKHAKDAPTWPS